MFGGMFGTVVDVYPCGVEEGLDWIGTKVAQGTTGVGPSGWPQIVGHRLHRYYRILIRHLYLSIVSRRIASSSDCFTYCSSVWTVSC